MATYQPPRSAGLLYTLADHPVAVNILMVVILGLGAFALNQINVRFFPDISLGVVSVDTYWPGAAADDVEQSITNRFEPALKNVNGLKKMSSTSRLGASNILLTLNEGTDERDAKDEVTRVVEGLIGELPSDAEQPQVSLFTTYEEVVSLIITAPSRDRLRILTSEIRDELLDRGVERVTFSGLPDDEIAIQIPGQQLRDLGLSLNQIGRIINSQSKDASIGISGRDDAARQLRMLDRRRTSTEFDQLPIATGPDGRLITLGDIATIEKRPKRDQVTATHLGKPAVEMQIFRLETGDSLESAEIVRGFVEEITPTLPEGVTLNIRRDHSVQITERLNTLINNGLMGLVLVLIVLYLFLNARLALWVAVGIPVSLAGAFFLLLMWGGSLDMVTMFGFILTIGIIVDDAIVVGEEALTQFEKSLDPLQAAYTAAKRMLMPILAASLTTVLAFLPVMIAKGDVGQFLAFIALVVIFVVITSVVEAFLILPGHLRGAFEKILKKSAHVKQSAVDRYLSAIRDGWYRSSLGFSIDRPIVVLATCLSLFVVTVGLLASGRLSYDFFPSPDLNQLFGNIIFAAGTPAHTVEEYANFASEALLETNEELGGDLIVSSATFHGAYVSLILHDFVPASNYAYIVVELVDADLRSVRTGDFAKRWESKLKQVPGLERAFVVTPTATGTGENEFEYLLSGASKTTVKNAAVELATRLNEIPGVYGVADDASYGRQQQILSLTPFGETLGLSVADIGAQLRASIDGLVVQSFSTPHQEIDVTVTLPDSERDRLGELDNVYIILPSGDPAALLDVVDIQGGRGFDVLRHENTDFTIRLAGNVDRTVGIPSEIQSRIDSEILPSIARRYDVEWKYGGTHDVAAETERSMLVGFIMAVILIYLTLALIFGSYVWPIVVMMIIPFGVIGAIWGHVFLDLEITILTILGIFGLSGIVVNNAIVLIVFYKQNREAGQDLKEAMLDAGCQRLRPIILSTLTTTAGLTPLLFERSTQAQFLIPMAATLVFGLLFSTVLVLYLIPAMLAMAERISGRLRRQPSVAVAEDVAR